MRRFQRRMAEIEKANSMRKTTIADARNISKLKDFAANVSLDMYVRVSCNVERQQVDSLITFLVSP